MQALLTILSWIFWIFIIVLIFITLWILVIMRIIRRYYKFPAPSFATRFIDNPIRRRFIQKPDLIAERMNLDNNMVVVEVGPGKGNYTKAIAGKILPDGKMYATDISKGVINMLKNKVKKENLTNIIPQIENAYEFTFENDSVDRIFMNCCLPEIPEPVRALKDCKRILKPDGRICLCEWFIDPDYPRRKTEKRWAKEAGLVLKEEFGNWWTYQLQFGKE